VYAYFYLLGERGGEPPVPYDRRFRVACDLYNTALAQTLIVREEEAKIGNRLHELPVGTIFLELRSDWFPYELESFETFVPADELSVHGLSVRDRQPGLGAPFIAVGKKDPDWPVVRMVPGTVFLRVEGDIRDLKEGARGRIELYSSYEKRVVAINDKEVPLENDLSAHLARTLDQPFLWKIGSRGFFKGAVAKSGIYPVQPYSPGRIPVVFVHGTFSSPVWWAEMFNTLRSDSVLWEKYQFWFYLYDSGKPIVLSSVDLRESLSNMVAAIDPEGKDKALKEMVVVGHSQGGLLTKVTAVETGDALVRATTNKGIDELYLNADEQAIVERYLIYSPLPFVSRVIFISTPHRGSYRASGWIRGLVKKIISFPADVLKTSYNLFLTADKMGMTGIGEAGSFNTSLDGMSPDNPGLLALADIPLAPGITGHSIIAIKGDEKPPDGDDGVVKYTSAHIDYVESEFIIRSGHSCQGHPLVIEEVRRILLKHLDSLARF
jgi:pimeloyl-ACP methyl ester carboxylesterase